MATRNKTQYKNKNGAKNAWFAKQVTPHGVNTPYDGSYISGSTWETMTPHKHKTRKHIYLSSKCGLLYEDIYKGKRDSPGFLRIMQKMTECQELEIFRKADGVVRMTSRNRGRVPPPSDQTLTEESE